MRDCFDERSNSRAYDGTYNANTTTATINRDGIIRCHFLDLKQSKVRGRGGRRFECVRGNRLSNQNAPWRWSRKGKNKPVARP